MTKNYTRTKSNANGKNTKVFLAMVFSLYVNNFQKLLMLMGKWVHLGSGFQIVSPDSLRFAQTFPPKFISWNDDGNVIVNATNSKREKKDAREEYKYHKLKGNEQLGRALQLRKNS